MRSQAFVSRSYSQMPMVPPSTELYSNLAGARREARRDVFGLAQDDAVFVGIAVKHDPGARATEQKQVLA